MDSDKKITETDKQRKQESIKNDYGENYIAPDGGWGWLVCLAAGISNLCIFPPVQVFGLIYREKLISLHFTNFEITTIMNSQNAMSSGTGLLNGPMFRKLSFRQVGLVGATLISLGIFLSAYAHSFSMYLICYSIIFGFGSGIMVSATNLALNTYFKEKRRRAASLTWTITGLGPFIFPYIVTEIVPMLGFQGTVWLFTGLSMHSFASALIYQPVKWHTKVSIEKFSSGKIIKKQTENIKEEVILCRYCEMRLNLKDRKNSKLFSSQYIYQRRTEDIPGHEFVTRSITMLAKANEGWYGSTVSLNKSSKIFDQRSFKNLGLPTLDHSSDVKKIKRAASSINLEASFCTCLKLQLILKNSSNDGLFEENIERSNLKWYHKIVVFFDLNLLKDLKFVNLVIGMTFTTFADFNFTVLMPFFLVDFGFSNDQVAILMSLIGGSDILMRILVPFIVENMKWDNRIFFIIAVSGMTIGRIFLAHKPSYNLAIFLFLWIGAFKGLRTIFLALIIPSHVPLKRLPAASGLQLLTSGIFTVLCGPIVGIIRDMTNYTFTLYFLNLISLATILSWSFEMTYEWYLKNIETTETSS